MHQARTNLTMLQSTPCRGYAALDDNSDGLDRHERGRASHSGVCGAVAFLRGAPVVAFRQEGAQLGHGCAMIRAPFIADEGIARGGHCKSKELVVAGAGGKTSVAH